MKKKLLLLMLSMALPIVAWCEDGDIFTANTVEGIEMTFKVISEAEKTCQVGKGLGATVEPSISKETMGTITVPDVINGYTVTTLAVNAFCDCTGLSSVSVPNTITAIGTSAFQNTQWYNDQPDGLIYVGKVAYKYKGTMPSGTSIVINDGTLGIAESCFRDYTNLKAITIPDGLTNIGELAFYGCSNLNTFNIPSSVTNVGKSAFYNTQWYNSQPNGLVYVGQVAYKYKGTMPSETSITINEGTLGISTSAFSGCSGLVSVFIPSSVSIIGESAFYGCKNLATLTISNGVKRIGLQAFSGCSGLTDIAVPNSVTSIDSYAFSRCGNLVSINIPNGVKSIKDYTFYECSSLQSINIPGSILSIGSNAFTFCAFSSLTIPYGVKKINAAAFHHCTMSSVTIAQSVEDIADDVFTGCSNLSSVTIYSPLLNTYGARAFDDNASGRKIYVLADKVTTYQAGWSGYSSDIQAIALPTNDAGSSGSWCTYYNEGSNVTVASGTTIYKAALDAGNNQVLLTEVEGNIIKAGEAVVLNSTSGSIELSSAASAGTGDYSGNGLKGGSSVAAGNVPYTLANSTNGLGFYKFDIANYTLDPYKAHLEVASSGARKYYGFRDGDDNTTSIKTPVAVTEQGDAAVYDLTGRRIEGYQLNRGVYVKNGKKFIVK